jgi:hypothetical protein
LSAGADRAWRIVEDDLSGAAIRALLEVHFAGMLANSPAGSCHFLDFDGLRSDGVTFWSIHKDDALAGCGALKMLGGAHGEIKSCISSTKRAAGASTASVSKPDRDRRSNPRWRSTAHMGSRTANPSATTNPTRSAAS